MFGGFFKNMVKTADEVIISGIKVGAIESQACIPESLPNGFSSLKVYLFFLNLFSFVLGYFLQEVDDFFEQEKTFLLDYYSKIKDSTIKAEKMTRSHKSIEGVMLFSSF